ncbi:MAG: sensor histidine kinase [Tissierellia bacterium]|nr:sensor histidine kinase [Tissierellia bacterium]
MIKNKNFLFILKILILIILFLSAIYFENAHHQRLIVLIVIFALFLSNNVVKYYIKDQNKLFILFFVDIALIYILETNSRLLINYFFHSFYIIIFLEASFLLPLKKGITIGIVTVIISMIKYAYLIYYKFNLSNVSQMVFFLMVNILILVIAAFAQHTKEEKEKKDILYKELLDTHRQLKEYTDELNRLSVIEERNRIARDIHDTLGHNMTALIMQLQMADHYVMSDAGKSSQMLKNSLNTAKESLSKIREVVETLRGKEISPEIAIKTLVEEFSEKTGAGIKLNIEGEIPKNYGVNSAIYHILQEGMTNSIRHGNASKLWINLIYSNENIKFNIKDNGQGALAFIEGFGLKGIRERVEAFGGNVEFKSQDGFIIDGELEEVIND